MTPSSAGPAPLSRRAFLARMGLAGSAMLVAAPRWGGALAQAPASGSALAQPVVADSSNLFPMDQTASRPVRLPPKAGARASMTAAERDDLEHRIRCQCGCTLDVFTCRTTDFSCRVSPAMHRDVMSLVEGGYSAQEILDAFVGVYGERALMAPTTKGFNLLGWAAPFVAVGAGGLALFAVLRTWRRPAVPAGPSPNPSAPVDATEAELARLRALVRDDE